MTKWMHWMFALAGLVFLSGCADTERSWAYPYRHRYDEPTTTPLLSRPYRSKDACEHARTYDIGLYRVPLDRCVLQPPITVGWIEWEFSVGFKTEKDGKITDYRKARPITQSWRDCRKLGDALLATFAGSDEEAVKPSEGITVSTAPGRVTITAEGESVTVTTSACRPIYIAHREAFTPLSATEFEGILARHRIKDGPDDPRPHTGR
jgi:hypothetical protein